MTNRSTRPAPALLSTWLGVLLSLPGGMAAAQPWSERLNFPAGSKVLVRHADDAGMFPETNTAVENLFSAGQIDSASLMPPLHFMQQVVDSYRANPNRDMGLHLTLTSEWTNYKWGPVTEPAGDVRRILTRAMVFRKDSLRVWWVRAPNTVGEELRAQVAHALALLNPTQPTQCARLPPNRPANCLVPTHLDSHMGSIFVRKSYFKKYLAIARENGIPALTFQEFDDTFECLQGSGRPLDAKLFNWHIRRLRKAQERFQPWPFPRLDRYCTIRYGDTFDDTRDNLVEMIRNLKPGITQVLFHPSDPGPLLKLSTHIWQKRVWDASLFGDPLVQAEMASQGVVTTNWRDMMSRCVAAGLCP